MTFEENDMRAKHFKGLVERINQIILDKWPETLADGRNAFAWAREHAPELMARHDKQEEEVNSLWLNGVDFTQFKEACTQWGRISLEVFQGYAAHLRVQAAA
jgi:hypothetical protein